MPPLDFDKDGTKCMLGKRIFHANLFGECSCCMILKVGWTWTLSLLSGCFQDHIKAVFKCCLNWTQRWTRLVGRGCHLAVMYICTIVCYHCYTSDIFLKSEFDWPLNSQVTFSQMFLKGPAHLQLFTTTMAFSQSQGAISDILILDLHLHVLTHNVDFLVIQFWNKRIMIRFGGQIHVFKLPNFTGWRWLVWVWGITSDPEQRIVSQPVFFFIGAASNGCQADWS